MISIFEMIRKLFRNPILPRGEIRFVDYVEGDRLISTGEWKLAIPEEDTNHKFCMVCVEKIIK